MENSSNNFYNTIIIGSGASGIFAAYELIKNNIRNILIIEAGKPLHRRNCIAKKAGKCVDCKSCSIMNGFGGAGAFSDGKYNITNDFGGNLWEHIGKEKATELMEYVDAVNLDFCPEAPPIFYTNKEMETDFLKNDLHLLNGKVRHLGTDLNYKILERMYCFLVDNGVKFSFNDEVISVTKNSNYYPTLNNSNFVVEHDNGNKRSYCQNCIVSVGRSGSKWCEKLCRELDIPTTQNRVDIGVRVELPAPIFEHITDKVYESKIVYRTKQYQDLVRTFCMNPHGAVVTENTNGIITVNGHSYEDKSLQSENTNFALLVSKHLTEPFNDSNEYGEAIARLSNMLGGGVIVQRFGDLIRGQRSTESRIKKSFVKPTLNATAGDLSLVIPKRILDDIIEMIYQLDKIAKGTANDDTLLYGVEVKFYNMEVEVDNNLETKYKGLYIIGDGSGITHSLSQASASGVYVAKRIANG